LINRRNVLVGGLALAGHHKLLRSMGAVSIGGGDTPPIKSPQNLLSTTFPESFLEKNLIPMNQWHPYPRWGDRGPWEAIPEDIRAAFVAKAEADSKEGWKALLATAFLEFKRNGNRRHYQDDTFGRRGKLFHLVMAECMEGKGRFMDDIMNGVWLICEESFWGVPAHLGMQRAGVGLPDVSEPIIELFGAATAQQLAWTKYLLDEQLNKISPLIGKRITMETERRILEPARERNNFSWMGLDGKGGRLSNWNTWINSNLLVANLILEEDPRLRVLETSRILKSVDAYLNVYSPDAAEEEGPRYFNESPLCYFEVASMVQAATGNSRSVLANPFIDAMGRYILNAHVAGDDYTNYGDADVHADPPGDLVYRFGKAVHDPQLEAYGAWCAARNGFTATGNALTRAVDRNGLESMSRALPVLLEANEIRQARRENVLLRDSWYPVFGMATARAKADSAGGMYFSVLAANNNRSHNHNDTGSYIIYLDGKPVAIDIGAEAYTAKNASPNRYSIWTMQSAYHNLPTIDGVMEHAGPQYRATEREYSSNDERATYSFDIASAYPPEAGVNSWVRTVTLDRVRDIIIVNEYFELQRPVPVSLTIMTPRLATVNASGSMTLKLAAGDGRPCVLKYDGAEIEPRVEMIKLTDKGLRDSWGDQIYRILLNSKQHVASGKWTYEFGPV
jgi:hypothetical protein